MDENYADFGVTMSTVRGNDEYTAYVEIEEEDIRRIGIEMPREFSSTNICIQAHGKTKQEAVDNLQNLVGKLFLRIGEAFAKGIDSEKV